VGVVVDLLIDYAQKRKYTRGREFLVHVSARVSMPVAGSGNRNGPKNEVQLVGPSPTSVSSFLSSERPSRQLARLNRRANLGANMHQKLAAPGVFPFSGLINK
jgi:hypothetical protein